MSLTNFHRISAAELTAAADDAIIFDANVATAVLSPFVAGVNDSSAWTVGPEQTIKSLGRPRSTMTRRPIDFNLENTKDHIVVKGPPQ